MLDPGREFRARPVARIVPEVGAVSRISVSSARFVQGSLANVYRHIGDAVPTMLSRQVAHLVKVALGLSALDVTDATATGTAVRRTPAGTAA